ncbi:MAG TPA: hypothetical protein VF110_03355 [Burkholderiales bacterium]
MASIDVLPTTGIASPIWDEIWGLTQAYYDTDRDFVEARLRAHSSLGLIRAQAAGELVGMASVDVYEETFRGRRLAVIFTSHVLLREAHRGHNLIQRLGLRVFLQTRLRHPLLPIYWFFDTFSYKSYLLLSRNLREYWPRHDRPTPEWEGALMAHLAERMYGADWRPEQGIVARSGRKRLRAEAAPIDGEISRAPDLRFFVRSNPGHAEGDMLVCLCPLSLANWAGVAWRALGRALS